MIEAQQPQADQPTQYTPAGPPDPLIFEDFEGIDTATTCPGVDAKKAYWLDGFMPLGPKRNFRTMWDIGPLLWDASTATIASISFFDFGNIGATPLMFAVMSDGAIYQVNMSTSIVSLIAPTGTILNPSRLNVGLTQYGSQYIIFVAKQTDGYFIWDGVTFHTPGSSFLSGTMPLGLGGTAVEIYAGRVWIANGAGISFSAPGSIIDFSSANGGGNFISSDSFLRVAYTQLKQTNGFLYLIGDSSVNYISGVNTSGSPPITTFTNQNADPEVGTPWPSTVDVFNRNILFANAFGAQVSYGGAVTKISEALDGVYNTVPNFGNLIPSSAKAIVFGKKIWILLLPIIDPVTGQQVNKLLMWNGKLWWASEQGIDLVYIQSQEINSVLTAFGSDGIRVYPLFGQPSGNFLKTAQTKLWDTPGGYQFTKFITRLWGIVKYYSPISEAINVALDNELGSVANAAVVSPNLATWLTAGGAVSTWVTAALALSTWVTIGTGFSVFVANAVAQEGILTGFTVTTNAGDVAIVSMMIHNEIAGYRG